MVGTRYYWRITQTRNYIYTNGRHNNNVFYYYYIGRIGRGGYTCRSVVK